MALEDITALIDQLHTSTDPARPDIWGAKLKAALQEVVDEFEAQAGSYVAGKKVSTDGSHGLPTPSGSGLEFVFTAAGLDDIRYDGVSQ